MATLDGVVLGAVLGGPRSGNGYEGGALVLNSHDAIPTGALLSSDGPVIERGGGGVIGGLLAGGIASNWWNGELSETARYIGRHVPTEVQGVDLDGTNYWTAVPANARRAGATISPRINWISPDRHMLGVSVPGKFIKLFDGGAVVGEAYHLTQHKPWEAHEDRVALEAETYNLTIISGWPSTPPRHVSQVTHPEGILVEWDEPADEGSAPIQEYRLYRGLTLGSMEIIATVDGDARHYFDADPPAGSMYRVYAYNGVLESDPATAVDITDPDTVHLSLRDALSGAAWTGLPYAGWMGVRGIKLSPAGTFVLRQGTVRPIVPTVFPADATVQTLAWSSDREDIATVDASGLVRGVSPGRAVIYATATDGTEAYASVPVIVAPAFMTDDMREYLQAVGFERVFTRAMPDALDRSITLLQGAGTAPDLALDIDRPVLRVLIVAPDLREAEETRKRVHDALHMAGPLDIGGVRYLSVEALSSGEYVEKTRRGPRYVCTLSFMIEKERTMHIVSDPVRANEIVGRSP